MINKWKLDYMDEIAYPFVSNRYNFKDRLIALLILITSPIWLIRYLRVNRKNNK